MPFLEITSLAYLGRDMEYCIGQERKGVNPLRVGYNVAIYIRLIWLERVQTLGLGQIGIYHEDWKSSR